MSEMIPNSNTRENNNTGKKSKIHKKRVENEDRKQDKKGIRQLFRGTRRGLNRFFILNTAAITIVMILLSGLLAYWLASGIALRSGSREYAITLFFLWITASTVVAHLFLYYRMRVIIGSIEKIDKATQKVAKGDFRVTTELDKRVRISELESLYTNFNHMVRELGTIETLRDNFIADVSHEFKTPIAAIDGYATLLQDESLSGEERQRYIESILYNSRRLTNLTGNILMISKLDNGSIKVDRKKYRLDEQLRRVVLTFEEEWTKKNLNLDIDLDPVDYIGDEDLLYHVWLNLISNAIKFSEQDGDLRIRLKGNGIVIIEDNGSGMSEETKKHLFDKFYQGDSSRSSEGNGLGLALVKSISDICKIKIEVESEEGRGTKFTLSLPNELE